ncbi:DUF4328 domain-containing protein [Herbidospora mongoliensis]|uniref:DUF4328 domain-containing protein n=1 Tax=Herbidospora mongoliensis TaxID=688067 RepID=UPI00082E530E|nr:DUF4328 domain-containing protein [Herbidospora mongoliensis]
MHTPQRSEFGVYAALTIQITSLAALVTFEELRGRDLAQEVAVFGGDPKAPGAQAVVGDVTIFAVLVMAVVVTTLFAAGSYLSWLSSATRTSKLTATAAWLVPGVNLVAPMILADQAWRESGKDSRLRWLLLLGGWWAAGLTTLWLTAESHATHTNLTGLGVRELTAAAVTAMLCAATVWEVSSPRMVRVMSRQAIAASK